eukprot:CAMPEP_0184689136 /NCGR_PEP_ID=MMETSP0312-20130426/30487_1 /TAXON_ID=31354 /ORGANISM="Compsopogon coeruleus, Strain SAG 36.94" /LENGTH=326 /DNA_ID=CAMNT_0027146451 /DNA_START=141 /DNA_END=1121 /DNA_ORIENTATION=-
MNAAFALVHGVHEQRPHAIYRAGLAMIDCVALLFAVVVAKRASRPVNADYTFGHHRMYVLSGFLLSVVVMLDSVLRAMHALEMFIWGPEPNEPQEMGRISLFEAGIGVFGVGMFHSSRRRHARWPKDDNLEGVFLHALAELMDGFTLATAALLTSSLTPRARLGAMGTAMAAAIAARVAFPLLQSTTYTLLHATPQELQSAVNVRLRKAALTEGVTDFVDAHFWPQAPGVYVGTLRVLVRPDVNEQLVLSGVLEAFDDLLDDITVHVEKDLDRDRDRDRSTPLRVGVHLGSTTDNDTITPQSPQASIPSLLHTPPSPTILNVTAAT